MEDEIIDHDYEYEWDCGQEKDESKKRKLISLVNIAATASLLLFDIPDTMPRLGNRHANRQFIIDYAHEWDDTMFYRQFCLC